MPRMCMGHSLLPTPADSMGVSVRSQSPGIHAELNVCCGLERDLQAGVSTCAGPVGAKEA